MSKEFNTVESSTKAFTIARDMLTNSVSKFSDSDAKDIYALSFYIYGYEDDPRFPILKFGYNTHANYETSIQIASDKCEAKWNYAFWL
jgi:hypothetical protein